MSRAGRATGPMGAAVAAGVVGSRVAGGHREATRSALDAGTVDANLFEDRGGGPGALWDEGQVAELLGVSVQTVARLRKRGVGPPYVRVGRRIVYRLTAVNEWIEQGEQR